MWFFVVFCLFFAITQDAIKYNSFLCPEKKLEQGNIEEAFEKVDQIVEGKKLKVFDRILMGFYSETDSESIRFPLRKSILQCPGALPNFPSSSSF